MIKKSKRDRMTPLLNELYWLPVKFRIEYKIATYVYRHFDNTRPSYLSENLLKIPKHNLKSFGQRSFTFSVLSV